MSWLSMSDKRLISILEVAVNDSKTVLKTCYYDVEKKIARTVGKMESEIEFLKTAEDKASAVYSSHAQDFIYELYGLYRVSLHELVRTTQWPFTAELLLDADEAREETLTFLDHKVDGIFVFQDGNMLRIRIPPLPHKNNSRLTAVGNKELARRSSTGIYSEALYRVFCEKSDELLPLRQTLGKKTIHILNVFADEHNPIDNDNRDTGSVINIICGFLPCGDVPYMTRICNDGYLTDAVTEGTYITVLPYETGLADNEQTIQFWKTKLVEVKFNSQ